MLDSLMVLGEALPGSPRSNGPSPSSYWMWTLGPHFCLVLVVEAP